MNDLISRKWLMECVDEGWIKFDTEEDKNRYIHLVRDIAPSAEPKTCDDLISRQAAIDIVEFECGEWRGLAKTIVEEIEKLPSAQPERKKGKWTKDCACEFCGFKPWYERDIHTLSFCPNCGAGMREEDT